MRIGHLDFLLERFLFVLIQPGDIRRTSAHLFTVSIEKDGNQPAIFVRIFFVVNGRLYGDVRRPVADHRRDISAVERYMKGRILEQPDVAINPGPLIEPTFSLRRVHPDDEYVLTSVMDVVGNIIVEFTISA